MLAALQEALPRLRPYLTDPTQWRSLCINYEKPHVQRLWIPWGDHYRLALHRIWRCEAHEALLHPHPWPSAVFALDGYTMGVGYGSGTEPPPIMMHLELAAGTFYEMPHLDGWHFVQPSRQYVESIMLTGMPWNRPTPVVAPKQAALTEDVCLNLLESIEHRLDRLGLLTV